MTLGKLPTDKIRLNLMINGHRTSMMLEAAVWNALTEICRDEESSLDDLCSNIVRDGQGTSMASMVRVYVVEYLRGARAA